MTHTDKRGSDVILARVRAKYRHMRFENGLQREMYYRSQIDYSYWRIQQIANHTGEMQSPLAAMIDKATGFDVFQVKQRIDEVRYLVGCIVKCKKKLDCETSADEKFLQEVKKLSKQPKQTISATISPNGVQDKG